MSLTNNGSQPTTVILYIWDLTKNGQELMRKYVVSDVPADKAAHSYTVKWADGVDLCPLATGDSFSQTTILGMGFGVDATSPASKIDLIIGNITFVAPPVTATPCTGICTSPTVFTKAATANYQSPNLGTGEVCYETTSEFGGGNWGEFVAPRVLSLNNTALSSGNFGASSTFAKRNGGYCFSAPAGNNAWAYFQLWN
jgi:hypothetical protein